MWWNSFIPDDEVRSLKMGGSTLERHQSAGLRSLGSILVCQRWPQQWPAFFSIYATNEKRLQLLRCSQGTVITVFGWINAHKPWNHSDWGNVLCSLSQQPSSLHLDHSNAQGLATDSAQGQAYCLLKVIVNKPQQKGLAVLTTEDSFLIGCSKMVKKPQPKFLHSAFCPVVPDSSVLSS